MDYLSDGLGGRRRKKKKITQLLQWCETQLALKNFPAVEVHRPFLQRTNDGAFCKVARPRPLTPQLVSVLKVGPVAKPFPAVFRSLADSRHNERRWGLSLIEW